MRGIACCYLLLLAVHYAGAQNDQPVTLILWMDKPTHHYSFTPAPLAAEGT